jgi:hypothetical protein
MNLKFWDKLPKLIPGSSDTGGEGCIMNIVSWSNGDKSITDIPACTYHRIRVAAINLNDNICKHAEYSKELCPECTSVMLGYLPLIQNTPTPRLGSKREAKLRKLTNEFEQKHDAWYYAAYANHADCQRLNHPDIPCRQYFLDGVIDAYYKATRRKKPKMVTEPSAIERILDQALAAGAEFCAYEPASELQDAVK